MTGRLASPAELQAIADSPRGNGREDVVAPKFPLVQFDHLTVGSEQVYLVKGLIPRVGLTVAWGPPKCGKSFWAFDVSMHVALGRDYRGRRVNGGAVVYCAFEGADGFKRRAEAYRQRFLPEEPDPIPFYLSPSPIDLVKDCEALIASIRAQAPDPVLVVLDTLNRSLAGSESDDKDMTAYIKAADAIRDAFGCAVIVVHHCGVDASRPRGHTALAGAVDAQLAVKRDKATDKVIVTVERMKDGPEGDQITSALESVEIGFDSDGDPITSCVVVPAEPLPQSKDKPQRAMSARSRLALEALDEVILAEGNPAPAALKLPNGIKVAPLESWKAEVIGREIIGADDKNQRTSFKRICDQLAARHAIGRRDGMVWKVAA